MSEDISPSRHQANLVGSLLLALTCIPVCVYLAVGLATLPPDRPGDPDAGKADGIYRFGIAVTGLLGIASLVAVVRSARALKGR